MHVRPQQTFTPTFTTSRLRHGFRMPTHRTEECLFATQVPEFPPSPSEVGLASLQQSVAQALQKTLSNAKGSPVLVATDGSSKHSVSAFALVIQASPNPVKFAAAHQGGDQSSFQAECQALLALASAVVRAAEGGSQGRIIVLCDCQAATLHATTTPESGGLPVLADAIQGHLRRAAQSGLHCEICWVRQKALLERAPWDRC